ncbi:manganese efflux pump MntP [Parasphingorhabdus sp.]|uniref:manganese efflux pump MntP n=1 Tax=Parasphingorhabdus sp. TaxID=2709688 RepID=UPI0030036866
MIALSILLLSLGLATDAFAAAVAQGASARPSRTAALRMSFAFGLAQAVMPLLGWALGMAFAAFVQSVAHWIAFALLGILGLRMIREGFDRDPEAPGKDLALWPLLVMAVATSIDAAIAGITLPSFGAPVLVACLVIGLTTSLLTYPGAFLGAQLGTRVGKWAEVLGGLILIGLGAKIFIAQQFFAA